MSRRLRLARLLAVAGVGVLGLGLGGLAAAASGPTGPDPSGPAQFGLCNAFLHGKGKGAHHKRDAVAFKALAKFVATDHSDMTVMQFCEQVVAAHASATTTTTGGTAPVTAEDAGRGTPPSTEGGTGIADQHSGGQSQHGTDVANTHSDGHSAAGSNNADGHRP